MRLAHSLTYSLMYQMHRDQVGSNMLGIISARLAIVRGAIVTGRRASQKLILFTVDGEESNWCHDRGGGKTLNISDMVRN